MTVENEMFTIVNETKDFIDINFPNGAIWECSRCEAPLTSEEECNCDSRE